jgi:hypothetical protein
MSLTIEQIEAQIAELQKNLETLKEQKLQVSRSFTGQYFNPYKGMQYRRMESDGVPIWECYLDTKKNWVLLNKQQSEELEKVYSNDCLTKE